MFYIIEDGYQNSTKYLTIQGSDICTTTDISRATWFPTKEMADAVRNGYRLMDFVVIENGALICE